MLTIQKLDSELADNTELYNMAKSDSDIDSLEHINDETAKLSLGCECNQVTQESP